MVPETNPVGRITLRDRIADVVERADVRVVQRGDGAGLALEPLLQVRIGRDMLGQHLDGDGAVQAGVGGLVDLTHAAGAEGGVDLVGAEGGAGGQRHDQGMGTRSVSYWNQVPYHGERPRRGPCQDALW